MNQASQGAKRTWTRHILGTGTEGSGLTDAAATLGPPRSVASGSVVKAELPPQSSGTPSSSRPRATTRGRGRGRGRGRSGQPVKIEPEMAKEPMPMPSEPSQLQPMLPPHSVTKKRKRNEQEGRPSFEVAAPRPIREVIGQASVSEAPGDIRRRAKMGAPDVDVVASTASSSSVRPARRITGKRTIE